MINKKNIWFLTLFSLVLVLSVYYITMPDDIMIKTNTEPSATITLEDESANMVAARVSKEEKTLESLDELNSILTDVAKSADEKNDAYEKMKNINKTKGEELSLEQKIKEQYNLKSVVTIDGNQINVLVQSSDKNVNLANDIMRTIQGCYDSKMYISVKFE